MVKAGFFLSQFFLWELIILSQFLLIIFETLKHSRTVNARATLCNGAVPRIERERLIARSSNLLPCNTFTPPRVMPSWHYSKLLLRRAGTLGFAASTEKNQGIKQLQIKFNWKLLQSNPPSLLPLPLQIPPSCRFAISAKSLQWLMRNILIIRRSWHNCLSHSCSL